MKKMFSVALSLVAIAALGLAQETKTHIALTPADVKWGPAPPSLPKGAQLAVLSGDPGKAGPFVIRLKVPAGYKIAPHWHPTDENVTVISGTFALGMGEKFDQAALKEVPAGSYGMLPAEMRHFAMAKTAATVQVHGMGPFVLNYVNPADDPSKANARN
ncbi:MAG TPA: cupin domain-containing protein [Blastocatellia bacterium]|nr:cupin domain-containing protein [Blastocatellia bacterium]